MFFLSFHNIYNNNSGLLPSASYPASRKNPFSPIPILSSFSIQHLNICCFAHVNPAQRNKNIYLCMVFLSVQTSINKRDTILKIFCASVNSIGADFASDILRHWIFSFPPDLVARCLSALREILSGISSSPQNLTIEKSVVSDLFLPACAAAGKHNFWVIVCLLKGFLTLYS